MKKREPKKLVEERRKIEKERDERFREKERGRELEREKGRGNEGYKDIQRDCIRFREREKEIL